MKDFWGIPAQEVSFESFSHYIDSSPGPGGMVGTWLVNSTSQWEGTYKYRFHRFVVAIPSENFQVNINDTVDGLWFNCETEPGELYPQCRF